MIPVHVGAQIFGLEIQHFKSDFRLGWNFQVMKFDMEKCQNVWKSTSILNVNCWIDVEKRQRQVKIFKNVKNR